MLSRRIVWLLICDGRIGRQDYADDEILGMPHTHNNYRICAAYPGSAPMLPTDMYLYSEKLMKDLIIEWLCEI